MNSRTFTFALLGYSPECRPLLEAISSQSAFQLVAAYLTGHDTSTVRKLHPTAEFNDGWESLLHGTEADAVIYAAGRDDAGRNAHGEVAFDNDDVLRKLTQNGVPVVMLFPACSMVLGFELMMIQRDTSTVIVPYFPGAANPAWQRLGGWGSDKRPSEIGPIQEVVIERTSETPDRENVLQNFARDVLLLRGWLDPIRKISALGRADPTDPLNQLSIQMATDSGAVVRWNHRVKAGGIPAASGEVSASDAAVRSAANWTVVGEEGTVTFDWQAEKVVWSITRGAQTERGESCETAAEVLQQIRRVVRHGDSQPMCWELACRALELQDAVPASCRRGKTIDLHLDDVSEEQTFKAIMAAGGCLLLLALLFGLPLIGVLQAVLLPDLTREFWGRWPWSWIAPRTWPIYIALAFVGFLSLQLLRLVFRDKN